MFSWCCRGAVKEIHWNEIRKMEMFVAIFECLVETEKTQQRMERQTSLLLLLMCMCLIVQHAVLTSLEFYFTKILFGWTFWIIFCIFICRKSLILGNGLNYDLIMLIDAYVKCFVAQFISKPYSTYKSFRLVDRIANVVCTFLRILHTNVNFLSW